MHRHRCGVNAPTHMQERECTNKNAVWVHRHRRHVRAQTQKQDVSLMQGGWGGCTATDDSRSLHDAASPHPHHHAPKTKGKDLWKTRKTTPNSPYTDATAIQAHSPARGQGPPTRPDPCAVHSRRGEARMWKGMKVEKGGAREGGRR